MEASGPVVFFGTPRFAVPTLEALCMSGFEPAVVVSQPARAVGRGRRVVEPPVAARARELELEVRLVESVKDDAFLRDLEVLVPWVGVVVAFGQIFPPALLELPTEGCINLHASLLPKYRGAAPIQAAIAAGETMTGVTAMKMEAGLDSGPILLQEELQIGELETAPDVSGRLAVAGAGLMIRTLERLVGGSLEAKEQDPELATFAPKLGRADSVVDWSAPARAIFDAWRAYLPWPGLTSELRGEPVKILSCRRSGDRAAVGVDSGSVVSIETDLEVACGGGSVLCIDRLQRPGRGALCAVDFINGERLAVGERFGGEPGDEPREIRRRS